MKPTNHDSKLPLTTGFFFLFVHAVQLWEPAPISVVPSSLSQLSSYGCDVWQGVLLPGLVYIVDDDVSFHTAARQRLELAGYEMQIYSSAEQVLNQQRGDSRLGCLLVDVSIPAPNGLELQARLYEAGSTLPVVFVSAYDNIKTVVQTIKAGAEDFLVKPVTSDVLLAAIERAIARHDVSRKLRSELNLLRALVATLTPRERQVYNLVIRGKMNKQIAFELGATERTIKAHRHRVMEKMDVRSLAELVLIAERLGHSAV
jgi:FixJ family two-component response regulator